LWLGTHDGGLCKFDVKNNSYTNFTNSSKIKTSLPSNTIRAMCADGRYLWIGTENGGLSKMDMTTGMLTNYLYNKSDPNSIINNSIWSVHKDRQGRIWIGSFARGLCVLDALEDKIPVLDISMDDDLVNAIFIDSQQRMWIGTEDGLVLRDKSGFYRFRFDSKDKNSISSNAINCIFEDSKHRIWIGVWGGGINRFVDNPKSFVRYVPSSKRKTLTNADVFAIAEYSKTGELLLATFGGLNILKDERDGIFENPFKYPTEGDQIQFSVLEDRKHNLWVGARSGLSLYSIENKTAKRIDIFGDSTKVSDQINCLFEDHNGTLWVGSSGGLHQMVSPMKFVTYTSKDGLPVNFVQGILEDAHGNLWLGTTKGLVFFNTATKAFKTFDKSDGLISAELRRKSFFKSKEGRIYIGGNGINSFFPDSIFSNPHKPSIYITDLKIFNEPIKPKTGDGILKDVIAETKEIYLNHTYNFFSLHYVGINFTSSYKNQYAYKLEGFDKDWVQAGTQRFATFTNLDPGTYTFKVRASNNDGLWNEEGASLIIHVLPPWWKTWWFRLFGVLALIGLVLMIIVLRTKNMQKTNQILEETVDQKTKQIKEQNQKLKEQSEELAAQYEELIQSQEETSTQRDLLSQQNKALQESQKTIELQNENLEIEVAKRTQELVEYNHQLEQFAFITAHNLRAPVARILGLGQLLGLAKGKQEDQDQIYPKLINTAKEIDGVIKDLNTILELKKNNESYITDVDLATEILIIKGNLEREITTTQTSITTDFSQVPSIHTVKPYLDSILYNLVSNAIKYRHPDRKPVIEIKTTKNKNEICLSVTDNGLGIDTAQSKNKLFTLYSRFHSHVEGKGMGLYLVKTQLTAMGGRIEIESEVGKGTTFNAFFKDGSN
jgi:signal transduction histidine kinase